MRTPAFLRRILALGLCLLALSLSAPAFAAARTLRVTVSPLVVVSVTLPRQTITAPRAPSAALAPARGASGARR